MGQILGAHTQSLLVDETDGFYEWAGRVLESAEGVGPFEQLEQLRERAHSKYRRTDARRSESESVWVLQAPNLTWSHLEIAQSFPNARVVYMLRDVRAVVASMLRLPTIPFVDNQIRFFRRTGFIERDFPREWERLLDDSASMAVRMALVAKIKMSLAKNFETAGTPILRVRYEDLVSLPKATIQRVLSHVDLPFDPNCLEHHRVLLGHGPGQTDRTRPIDRQSVSKWRQQLAPETVASIWNAVGDFYEGLGYERGDSDSDAIDPTLSCRPEDTSSDSSTRPC